MNTYNNIISLQNLYEAWSEFLVGKKSKKDIIVFSLKLSENIIELHEELKNKKYKHGNYEAFNISDPKPRNIHKAAVRDRLLHHAIYKILYPYFDHKFIYDSYSCRNFKGTHRAMNRFNQFARKLSSNNHRTCWVLKCDVRKFFASIDHQIMLEIVKRHISEPNVLWLIQRIIKSFSTTSGKGLPLGNLTSQLLVNVYMNEFDQFIKHKIKAKYYIRYADDFVILSENKSWLEEILPLIKSFLFCNLGLELHPNKIFIRTFASGVDFLGWIHFPTHRVLRTTTKRRMFRKVMNCPRRETIQSYLGMLNHGNTQKIKKTLLKMNSPDSLSQTEEIVN